MNYSDCLSRIEQLRGEIATLQTQRAELAAAGERAKDAAAVAEVDGATADAERAAEALRSIADGLSQTDAALETKLRVLRVLESRVPALKREDALRRAKELHERAKQIRETQRKLLSPVRSQFENSQRSLESIVVEMSSLREQFPIKERNSIRQELGYDPFILAQHPNDAAITVQPNFWS